MVIGQLGIEGCGLVGLGDADESAGAVGIAVRWKPSSQWRKPAPRLCVQQKLCSLIPNQFRLQTAGFYVMPRVRLKPGEVVGRVAPRPTQPGPRPHLPLGLTHF